MKRHSSVPTTLDESNESETPWDTDPTQNLNNFFGDEFSAPPIHVTHWIKNHEFPRKNSRPRRVDKSSSEPVDPENSEFVGSPLDESITCWEDLLVQKQQKLLAGHQSSFIADSLTNHDNSKKNSESGSSNNEHIEEVPESGINADKIQNKANSEASTVIMTKAEKEMNLSTLENFDDCASESDSVRFLSKENEIFNEIWEKIDKNMENIKKNSPNIRKFQSIFCDISSIPSSSFESYDELLSIFNESQHKTGDSVSLSTIFPFDWCRYWSNRQKMQYFVWTQLCLDHDDDEFVEMTKNDKKCAICNGKNLVFHTRSIIPLDVSSIPTLPNEKLQIFVGILAKNLLKTENSSNLISQPVLDEMYKIDKLINSPSAKPIKDLEKKYEIWFNQMRNFIDSSLKNKKIRIDLGRIIRRKISEEVRFIKRQGFLFVDVFELINA